LLFDYVVGYVAFVTFPTRLRYWLPLPFTLLRLLFTLRYVGSTLPGLFTPVGFVLFTFVFPFTFVYCICYVVWVGYCWFTVISVVLCYIYTLPIVARLHYNVRVCWFGAHTVVCVWLWLRLCLYYVYNGYYYLLAFTFGLLHYVLHYWFTRWLFAVIIYDFTVVLLIIPRLHGYGCLPLLLLLFYFTVVIMRYYLTLRLPFYVGYLVLYRILLRCVLYYCYFTLVYWFYYRLVGLLLCCYDCVVLIYARLFCVCLLLRCARLRFTLFDVYVCYFVCVCFRWFGY